MGVIGALLGGVLAILLAVAGVVWYPVKRLLKKMKAAGNIVIESNVDAPENESEDDVG